MATPVYTLAGALSWPLMHGVFRLQVKGIENVGLFHIIGQPNMEIHIDRQKCARYGVNVADVRHSRRQLS